MINKILKISCNGNTFLQEIEKKYCFFSRIVMDGRYYER